jgi:hypothetical protein
MRLGRRNRSGCGAEVKTVKIARKDVFVHAAKGALDCNLVVGFGFVVALQNRAEVNRVEAVVASAALPNVRRVGRELGRARFVEESDRISVRRRELGLNLPLPVLKVETVLARAVRTTPNDDPQVDGVVELDLEHRECPTPADGLGNRSEDESVRGVGNVSSRVGRHV